MILASLSYIQYQVAIHWRVMEKSPTSTLHMWLLLTDLWYCYNQIAIISLWSLTTPPNCFPSNHLARIPAFQPISSLDSFLGGWSGTKGIYILILAASTDIFSIKKMPTPTYDTWFVTDLEQASHGDQLKGMLEEVAPLVSWKPPKLHDSIFIGEVCASV